MEERNKKRLKTVLDFLSLPCNVVSDICSFCEANEVLAISLTCPTLHQDVENSMLYLDVEHCVIPKVWKIPIFFPDQCHAVFFAYKILPPDRDAEHNFILVSRRRDKNERTDETMIWKKTKCIARDTQQMFYFSFRNDPSQEYFLRHEYRDEKQTFRRVASLRKQYIVNALTPPERDALTACLKMGSITGDLFEPMKNYSRTRADILPLLMNLFVVCFDLLSHVESHAPIRTFFDSACFKGNAEDSLESSPDKIRHVQEQVSNIFEQVLEQKEPSRCVKLQPPREEVVYPSMARSTNWSRQKLPCLLLTNEFVWNPSERRNGLEFVARIPLFPSTRRFSLTVGSGSRRNEILFVLFFQKRERFLEESESLIVGNVLVDQQLSFLDPISFDVDPKCESCFLYFVPDNSTTTVRLNELEVRLEIATFDNSRCPTFQECMELLLDNYNTRLPLRDRLLPVALLRDVALTLLGSDQGPHTALKEALDAKQIDTTPQGLQCIVDICNVMMDE